MYPPIEECTVNVYVLTAPVLACVLSLGVLLLHRRLVQLVYTEHCSLLLLTGVLTGLTTGHVAFVLQHVCAHDRVLLYTDAHVRDPVVARYLLLVETAHSFIQVLCLCTALLIACITHDSFYRWLPAFIAFINISFVDVVICNDSLLARLCRVMTLNQYS